jgi:hypothetical protein
MQPSRVSNSFYVFARPDLQFRSGDTVIVRVIKHLSGQKWAVSLNGHVFPAVAEAKLKAGDSFRAWIRQAGDRVYLHLKEPGVLHDALLSQGGDSKELSEIIISSLFRNKTSVNPEIVASLNHILHSFKQKHNLLGSTRDSRIARALSILLDKGIDPTSDGVDWLLRSLTYTGEREKRRQKKNHSEKDFSKIKKIIKRRFRSSASDQENPLQIFNHLKGKTDSWIIIPYNFHTDQSSYSGSIKILYDPYKLEVRRMVIEVLCGDDEILSFLLIPKKDKIQLNFFSDNREMLSKANRKIGILKAKLQIHGVECDDIIYDGKYFDGFSPMEDFAYKSVDTYT